MPTLLIAAIFIISIGGVLFIIARHLPTVSSLQPQELVHIQHEQLKAAILLARFDRFFLHPVTTFVGIFRYWSQRFGKTFYRLLTILKTLEHHYEKQALERQRTATSSVTVTETVEDFIEQGRELHTKKLYDDAERKYIAAIALDPKSLAAYEGLGELYFDQKNYEAARETFAHIVKLNERSAAAYARLGSIASASGNLEEAEKDFLKAAELANDLVASHIDLGVVHEALGKHEEALMNFLQAREREPKNPRVLDLLLATAITLGKRALAEETLAALAEANPENQKLEELQKRVAELPVEPAKMSQGDTSAGSATIPPKADLGRGKKPQKKRAKKSV